MGRPWYSFYPADYLRDTGELTLVEHGAYRLLMDHYYASGKPLSTDVERLLRLCRASVAGEVAAIRFVLDKFFQLGQDGYHHARIDAELKKAAEKAEKCSTAGSASATKRQHNTQHKFNGRSTDVSTDVPTERQPSQSQSHKKEDCALTRFDDFWNVYPKRVGRGQAERAWPKACLEADAETIIQAASRYAELQGGKDKTYVKHPATWLSGKCWLDDGVAPPEQIDPEKAAEARDRADRLMRRGKYSPINEMKVEAA